MSGGLAIESPPVGHCQITKERHSTRQPTVSFSLSWICKSFFQPRGFERLAKGLRSNSHLCGFYWARVYLHTQTTIMTIVNTVQISQIAFWAHKQVWKGGVATRIWDALLCLLSTRIMDLKDTMLNCSLMVYVTSIFQPAVTSSVEHKTGLGPALKWTQSMGLGSDKCSAAQTRWCLP